jgi:hypothetical protein
LYRAKDHVLIIRNDETYKAHILTFLKDYEMTQTEYEREMPEGTFLLQNYGIKFNHPMFSKLFKC